MKCVVLSNVQLGLTRGMKWPFGDRAELGLPEDLWIAGEWYSWQVMHSGTWQREKMGLRNVFMKFCFSKWDFMVPTEREKEKGQLC